jgi:hypothetical protein
MPNTKVRSAQTYLLLALYKTPTDSNPKHITAKVVCILRPRGDRRGHTTTADAADMLDAKTNNGSTAITSLKPEEVAAIHELLPFNYHWQDFRGIKIPEAILEDLITKITDFGISSDKLAVAHFLLDNAKKISTYAVIDFPVAYELAE